MPSLPDASYGPAHALLRIVDIKRGSKEREVKKGDPRFQGFWLGGSMPRLLGTVMCSSAIYNTFLTPSLYIMLEISKRWLKGNDRFSEEICLFV